MSGSAERGSTMPGGPLTDAASLARELAGSEPPVVLDVRWRLGGPPGIESYRAAHVPGAVFADLDAELAGPPGAAGRHPLPAAGAFQAAMRRAGVRAGHPVVVYDDGDSAAAARAWWTLRYFGHDLVRVLDGGFRAWQAAGLPVTQDEPAPAAGDITATAGHLPVLDADGAAALASSGILLDARAAGRYRGETEPVDPVAGHIPGAVSAPATANLAADSRFLPAADLRQRFAALGARPGPTDGPGPAGRTPQIGVYCGSGVTAAQEMLALDLAGIPAALYVGSWSAWVADPSRPVATGPGPGAAVTKQEAG